MTTELTPAEEIEAVRKFNESLKPGDIDEYGFVVPDVKAETEVADKRAAEMSYDMNKIAAKYGPSSKEYLAAANYSRAHRAEPPAMTPEEIEHMMDWCQ